MQVWCFNAILFEGGKSNICVEVVELLLASHPTRLFLSFDSSSPFIHCNPCLWIRDGTV